MEPSDILLLILLGAPALIWVGAEFKYRKSKDASWVKKAKRNKSVSKYRQSLVGRKLSGFEQTGDPSQIERKQFSEVEQEQLIKAYFREQQRVLWRVVPWLVIALILGTYIYHGGE
ncbi:hypothetical protein N8603_00365 [Verrucomicrobiales bacterium]|nr:hypothetical protein [Verrucomicrobiales bacterium]